jgi:hypothetical protein
VSNLGANPVLWCNYLILINIQGKSRLLTVKIGNPFTKFPKTFPKLSFGRIFLSPTDITSHSRKGISRGQSLLIPLPGVNPLFSLSKKQIEKLNDRTVGPMKILQILQ